MNDTTQVTQAERIIDKYADQIGSKLDQAIEAATPIAESAWGYAVYEQQVIGWLCVLGFVVTILIPALGFRPWHKWLSKELLKDNSEKGGAPIIVGFFASVILLFALSAQLSSLTDTIMRITAPEYMAAKEILGL